jgi:hypothetical protein
VYVLLDLYVIDFSMRFILHLRLEISGLNMPSIILKTSEISVRDKHVGTVNFLQYIQ